MTTELPVIFGGANAGGTKMAAVFADANAHAHGVELTVHAVDPNGGHLTRLADFATARGLRLTTEQRPLEAALATRADNAPLGIFIDAPGSIAKVLDAAAATGRPTLLYVAVLLATGDLLGLRAVLTAADPALFGELAALFRALSLSTVRSGSSAVFGPAASPRHVELEPLLREWFAAHMLANVYKLAYDLPPESAPIEVTRDGKATMPLYIHTSATAWADPEALARELLARPRTPVAPGTDVLIAEIGPERDVRLHEARLRRADRQVALRNASVPSAPLDEGTWPSLVAAIRRVTEHAITPTYPVYVTD